jgi:hypothetical protein
VLGGPLLKHEFPCKVTIANPIAHEGLVYAQWQQALHIPPDNGDKPHDCVRHDSARIAHGKALIIVHPPVDHFPHDEQEYMKMNLYGKNGLSDNLVSSQPSFPLCRAVSCRHQAHLRCDMMTSILRHNLIYRVIYVVIFARMIFSSRDDLGSLQSEIFRDGYN